jgi:hypothetical protein
MTFGKKRIFKKQESNDNCYELLRFCNKLNTSIIGGASKLFKYFINKYKPKEIISYASCSISNGKIYNILGFKYISHSLDFFWKKGKERFNRSRFMKHKLVKCGYSKENTEDEIMRSIGYDKV